MMLQFYLLIQAKKYIFLYTAELIDKDILLGLFFLGKIAVNKQIILRFYFLVIYIASP